MVIGAKTQLFLITIGALILIWGAARLMWPSNMAKLESRPDLCNDNSCCNAHGCNPPPP
jgi:hypothetical protein